MMLVCSHCGKPGGCLHLVAVAGAGDGAAQPAPAAPAPAPLAAAGQRNGRQEDPNAPICGRCRVNRVGKRRNGAWFPTCYSCG